jgi:hypothetical protein
LEDEWPALSRRRVVLAEAGRRQNAKIKRIEAKGNVIVVQKGESTTAFHLVEMPLPRSPGLFRRLLRSSFDEVDRELSGKWRLERQRGPVPSKM